MVIYEINFGGLFLLGSFNIIFNGFVGDFMFLVLGVGEFLIILVYEFGMVFFGFGFVDGIVLDYEVLVIDQLGNLVIGVNLRIIDLVYVFCLNVVYICILFEVEVFVNYEGELLLNDLCDDSVVVICILLVGLDFFNKLVFGNVFFVGDEVIYIFLFNVCGFDFFVNGLVIDDLFVGVNLVLGLVVYSFNIIDIGILVFNQIGSFLIWDFFGIDLFGLMDVEEDCGVIYIIEYIVEVMEVANGFGSFILNNIFMIDGDDVDIVLEVELFGDEDNIIILFIGFINLLKIFLNGLDGNFEDMIIFWLCFCNQGFFDVNNVVIVDELFMGFDFVFGIIQYNGGFIFVDNDGMVYNSGNCIFIFEWASLSGLVLGECYLEFYEIIYDVVILWGFFFGLL